MSNEQLKHIFDDSVCLTKRQMKDYVSGAMTNEEAHALEVHLNSCPFCSEAIEGMLSLEPGEASTVLNDLNANFLKEHLPDNHAPHSPVHHPPPATGTHTKPAETKKKTIPLWRTVSIAAALLLFLGILWYNTGYRQPETTAPLADKTALPEPSKPLVAANDAATTLHDKPNSEALLAAKQKQPIPETVKAIKQPATESAAPVATSVTAFQPAATAPATDANTGKKESEDVVVTSYKVPLIDKYAPGTTTTAKPEQVEKMATRNTENLAATNEAPAAKMRLGNSADEVNASADKERKKEKAAAASASEPDNMDEGNKLYAQKRYSAAVNVFQKEFSNTDKSRRHEAMLMAARCYLNMGNKDKATQLLQNIIEEGGSKKREAKKLLNVLSD